MATGRSWHIPTIFKYNAPTGDQVTNVVYLQRMSDTERQQVEDALNATDPSATDRLDIPPGIQARRLQCKIWIRDYFPSSSAILQIATDARDYHSTGMRTDPTYRTFIFVDSGWEVGNVMAAHWERRGGEGVEERLAAVRVPMGIANLLLTACDQVEGLTLAHALGQEAYEKAEVDFYRDLPDPEDLSRMGQQDEEILWLEHLPKDMPLNQTKPAIISLRQLDEGQIEKLKGDINADEEEAEDIEIFNWQGPEPSNRLVIRDLFNHMRRNTPSGEKMNHAFFIDYMLRDENDDPQILAVCRIDRDEGKGVRVMPVFTSEFLLAWEKASEGQEMDQKGEIVDIWKEENVDHLNVANYVSTIASACPVFFLQPFTAAEERSVRAAITALGDVDEGEDWGHLFQWHGYPFPDAGETHTLDDLRDLFQRCDPGSPFFDRSPARPYTLQNGYLTNFVAVDDRVLDAEAPTVWMVSGMDFYPEDDTSENLGWTAGRLRAEQSSIVFVNLDIANCGLDESVEDEGTLRRVWLGDLKAFREEEWEEHLCGQGGEGGGGEEGGDEEGE